MCLLDFSAKHSYSSNDDILSRFLQEAKSELEADVAKRKNKKPRKSRTPPGSVSARAEDYDVVRLAPHKHIRGKFI